MSKKEFGVAVKAIVQDSEGRTLLLKRSGKSKHCGGQWEWPGGKVDSGEVVNDALRREVKEECGLDIELVGFLGAPSFTLPEVHVVSPCFEATATSGDVSLSDEHEAYRWVEPSEYRDFTLAENVREFMMDYAEGIVRRVMRRRIAQQEEADQWDAWVTASDSEWVSIHVPRYKAVQRDYAIYAVFLQQVLDLARKKLAPLGIVATRPKAVPSFAEKILRKRKIYIDPKDPLPPDPLRRLTDLCGGRVITHTAEQVQAVCGFIEQVFDIDWANSEDASQRLKPSEFGYRSVHYIVQVNPEKLQAAGIDVKRSSGSHG